MLTALFVLLALYLLKILIFISGARRADRPPVSAAAGVAAIPAILPPVSVLVAARNEEQNISRCLEALSALQYDGEIEIIVVDDHSTDDTQRIMHDWAGRDSRIRVMQPGEQIAGLRGKANAIAQAIEQCKGEIILTTDADCAVPRAWVKETVAQYDGDTGCVCGYTLICTDSVFAGMQSLDWAYLMTIASAGVGWGYALSAVGNNMSFRRTAYHDVGGYQGIGFSVTEDFALFKAIAYTTKWKVRYPANPRALVWSEPCADFTELFRQKRRWGKGGLDIPKLGFGIMSIGFLMNAAILLLPIVGIPVWSWLAVVAGKSVGDAALLYHPLKKFGLLRLFRYFPVFALYYIVYVTVLPFVVVLG
ncbi:MAG: glycosyltransferase, partial [Bacteroidetes bacterium]|nr:glycosyltransferase [Bacteroidota bacterium]